MNTSSKIAFVMLWHISERTGGAEVQANYLAEELVKRGYNVSYICQTINQSKINTEELINGVKIYWIQPAQKFIWLNISKYFNCLKKAQPDIVVQRNSSPILYASKKYTNSNKAKLVWICTDNLAPFKDFFIKRYTAKNSIKSAGFLKYMVFYFNSILSDKIRNFAMKGIDLGFSQNSFQKQKIKENFGLVTSSMISGHHPNNNNLQSEKRFQDKIVLWCANFGTHKRPELFIELAKKMKDEDYTFIMIGSHSNNQYFNSILKDKPSNLTVTGHLGFDDALNYFNQASLFINTSTPGGDGFPNTFIQSWLRGVPVLSFGFNPDDIITDNNLGFAVNSENEAINCITEIFTNKEDYNKLSQNVNQYAMENHTIKIMTDHFLSVLDKKL